ncbi:ABC transporter ATP-binding protein [Pseudogemmatithrix spongiicola]|uniref:ABC transporter ATP-binding protein n=1 Tax=Pseudogemmatithrix spongiicola TaxID=3062599 RepID=A0AA49JT54_9BACT|nr:ABC transporter ATP-binding protein [Gemmatimonadaceae bacterium 'strain 138']WKW14345.1 ABC transporter ATP-binding protein [Gemmatimonadaceae bacterium 'strain 318']
MNSPLAAPVVVDGVRKRFGATTALDGVSFAVRDAELFGLVGPDGGGKTTLFRILTTLMVPDAGHATVLGLDVVRDLWAIRARVGYMPGRFSLYGDLTVEENLKFFASVFGTDLESGYALIAPIYRQIERFKDRRAAALSGGMKQKLALSCALVHRPRLLFLDEPTTGVDAVSRREFWDLLAELKASGLTIVVSTPYMDEAARCDRVALIQQGRVLAIDAPSRIGGRFPRSMFAVRARQRAGLLEALRRFPSVASAYPFGEDVHFSDRRPEIAPATVIVELHAYLAAQGLDEVRIREKAPGIEDAFIELMGHAPEIAA